MRRILNAAVAAGLTSSCVSTHTNKPSSFGNDIVTSCAINDSIEDPNVLLLTFTIENKGKDPKQFQAATAEFTNDKATTLDSKQSASFLEAYNAKRIQENYNRDMGVLGLVVGGAVIGLVGAANDNNAVRNLGYGTAAGASIYKEGKSISEAKDSAAAGKNVFKYGVDHVLSDPTEIYGGLFVRKHILVRSALRGEKLPSMSLCTKLPDSGCYKVVFTERAKLDNCQIVPEAKPQASIF